MPKGGSQCICMYSFHVLYCSPLEEVGRGLYALHLQLIELNFIDWMSFIPSNESWYRSRYLKPFISMEPLNKWVYQTGPFYPTGNLIFLVLSNFCFLQIDFEVAPFIYFLTAFRTTFEKEGTRCLSCKIIDLVCEKSIQ